MADVPGSGATSPLSPSSPRRSRAALGELSIASRLDSRGSRALSSRGDLEGERIWWSEAMLAAIQQSMAEHTRQLQACFADEAQKQEARMAQVQRVLAEHAEEQLRGCVAEEVREQARLSQGSHVAARHAEDGGAHRPQDALMEELHGIRSELGALRAALEGRPASEGPRSPRSPARGRAPEPRGLEESQTHAGAGSEAETSVLEASGEASTNAGANSVTCGDAAVERVATLQETVPILGPCLKVFRKLGTSEAPPRSDLLSRFVDGHFFHTMVYAAILLNCVFMVVAADEDIRLAIRGPDGDSSDLVVYGEIFFLTVYTLELIMKLWRFRLHFFYDTNWKYNWLDLTLVVLGIWTTHLFEGSLPNISWLRILRLLKLAKALRVLRLIAMVRPLRAILQSLIHTVDTLAWSILMLLVILFMFALGIVIRVASFLQEEPENAQVVVGEDGATVADKLEATFGSVGLTILHLFMCSTGGNDWSVYYDPLRPTGAINCVLFLFFIAFTQIAVLNIILGIFVDDAMKNMVEEKEERAAQIAAERRQIADELREICHEFDTDGNDGMLSAEEWRRAAETRKLQFHLELAGFRAGEVKELVDYMFTGEQEFAIHIDRFVELIMRFRGAASCFDMMMLLHEVGEVKASLKGAKNVHVEAKA